MDAYRDQYAQIFGDTAKVRLLAISIDADTTQAAWAGEKKYHWTFLSDPGSAVGTKYGAVRALSGGGVIDNRTLFVIDTRGKIAHVMAPFREVDPAAYAELTDAVKRISGGK
ncbi:MAG TPA: redoxin domain-containing protein [Gemmatimonadales bacterium]